MLKSISIFSVVLIYFGQEAAAQNKFYIKLATENEIVNTIYDGLR